MRAPYRRSRGALGRGRGSSGSRQRELWVEVLLRSLGGHAETCYRLFRPSSRALLCGVIALMHYFTLLLLCHATLFPPHLTPNLLSAAFNVRHHLLNHPAFAGEANGPGKGLVPVLADPSSSSSGQQQGGGTGRAYAAGSDNWPFGVTYSNDGNGTQLVGLSSRWLLRLIEGGDGESVDGLSPGGPPPALPRRESAPVTGSSGIQCASSTAVHMAARVAGSEAHEVVRPAADTSAPATTTACAAAPVSRPIVRVTSRRILLVTSAAGSHYAGGDAPKPPLVAPALGPPAGGSGSTSPFTEPSPDLVSMEVLVDAVKAALPERGGAGSGGSELRMALQRRHAALFVLQLCGLAGPRDAAPAAMVHVNQFRKRYVILPKLGEEQSLGLRNSPDWGGSSGGLLGCIWTSSGSVASFCPSCERNSCGPRLSRQGGMDADGGY